MQVAHPVQPLGYCVGWDIVPRPAGMYAGRIALSDGKPCGGGVRAERAAWVLREPYWSKKRAAVST
jgi:hypothetical protein